METTKIIELLSYTLPAIITGVVAYYFFNLHTKNEEGRRRYLLNKDTQKDALPLRLQAFERMTLFLERINPGKLLIRLSPNSENKNDYENLLISNIEQEFEHNLTQQIYMSDECWTIIVTAKNVNTKIWLGGNVWQPNEGQVRVSFYCKKGKFYFEGNTDGYVSHQLATPLVKNVCGRTAVVTPEIPLVVTPKSDHVCDTDTTSKLHQGKSYKYCKNGEKYYFIGTAGEFKTKHPNWTEATGKGLESIKTMIGPVFDKIP